MSEADGETGSVTTLMGDDELGKAVLRLP